MRYTSTSEAQTFAIAATIASQLVGGEVIALKGNLGAGKTTFTKGLAKAFGVKHTITSPTFVLMNVYPVKHKTVKQLVHIDCYRLEDPKELAAIGALEYFGQPDTVTVTEWPERIEKLLPKTTIHITFELLTQPAPKRIITITYARKNFIR